MKYKIYIIDTGQLFSPKELTIKFVVEPNKKNLIIDNSEDIQPIEQKIDNYISIYPNPSKGIINVDYSVPDGISSTLVFYDVNGRKISSYNLESNSKRICLNDETIFSEGVYYYSLIIGNEVVTRDKLVIIK